MNCEEAATLLSPCNTPHLVEKQVERDYEMVAAPQFPCNTPHFVEKQTEQLLAYFVAIRLEIAEGLAVHSLREEG
jgi:aspartate/glutamate racemase